MRKPKAFQKCLSLFLVLLLLSPPGIAAENLNFLGKSLLCFSLLTSLHTPVTASERVGRERVVDRRVLINEDTDRANSLLTRAWRDILGGDPRFLYPSLTIAATVGIVVFMRRVRHAVEAFEAQLSSVRALKAELENRTEPTPLAKRYQEAKNEIAAAQLKLRESLVSWRGERYNLFFKELSPNTRAELLRLQSLPRPQTAETETAAPSPFEVSDQIQSGYQKFFDVVRELIGTREQPGPATRALGRTLPMPMHPDHVLVESQNDGKRFASERRVERELQNFGGQLTAAETRALRSLGRAPSESGILRGIWRRISFARIPLLTGASIIAVYLMHSYYYGGDQAVQDALHVRQAERQDEVLAQNRRLTIPSDALLLLIERIWATEKARNSEFTVPCPLYLNPEREGVPDFKLEDHRSSVEDILSLTFRDFEGEVWEGNRMGRLNVEFAKRFWTHVFENAAIENPRISRIPQEDVWERGRLIIEGRRSIIDRFAAQTPDMFLNISQDLRTHDRATDTQR